MSRPASDSSTNVAFLDAPGSRSFVSKHDTYHYSLISLVKSEVSWLPCNTVRLGRVRPRRVENDALCEGRQRSFHGVLGGRITRLHAITSLDAGRSGQVVMRRRQGR